MGLNNRSSIDPRWQEWVRGPSRGFETARVQIIDPNSESLGAYNPVTNTGGTSTPIVVWPSANEDSLTNAWIEIIRSPNASNTPPQATDITQVRVHLDLDKFGPTEAIRPGFLVRVLNGGRDSILEHRIPVIRKTTTGNLAVQRTLECTIDEKVYIDNPSTDPGDLTAFIGSATVGVSKVA